MVKTYGLTHISLAVQNPERSLAFYGAVFGAREVYRNATSVQAQTPGSHDILAFERRPRKAGAVGGGALGGGSPATGGRDGRRTRAKRAWARPPRIAAVMAMDPTPSMRVVHCAGLASRSST